MAQGDTPIGQHGRMRKPPESTKASLEQRLCVHARERWPNIELAVRHRAGFAYADAHLLNGEVLVASTSTSSATMARTASGERNHRRFAAVKGQWDPDNVFRGNQNVKPA